MRGRTRPEPARAAARTGRNFLLLAILPALFSTMVYLGAGGWTSISLSTAVVAGVLVAAAGLAFWTSARLTNEANRAVAAEPVPAPPPQRVPPPAPTLEVPAPPAAPAPRASRRRPPPAAARPAVPPPAAGWQPPPATWAARPAAEPAAKPPAARVTFSPPPVPVPEPAPEPEPAPAPAPAPPAEPEPEPAAEPEAPRNRTAKAPQRATRRRGAAQDPGDNKFFAGTRKPQGPPAGSEPPTGEGD